MRKEIGAIFWVTAIRGDGAALALMLSDRREMAEDMDVAERYRLRCLPAKLTTNPEQVSISRVEVPRWEAERRSPPLYRGHAEPPTMLPNLRIGDLVVAAKVRGAADGTGIMVRLCEARVVGNATDEADIAKSLRDLLSSMTRGEGDSLLQPGDLEHDAEEDRARAQPNGALVAAYLDGDKIHTQILAHTGPYMFYAVREAGLDCQDMGIELPEAPGLYVIKDPKPWVDHGGPWNEYEYDEGLEGTLTPATPEQIASWGFDDARLVDHLRDEMELGFPQGMGWREALVWQPEDDPVSIPGRGPGT